MNGYAKDAYRLAACLAIAIVAAWAPFVFGTGTLLSSASDVPSLFVAGALPTADPHYKLYKVLDGGAPGWLSEPSLALTHRLVFDDRVLPLWDPYNGYGMPHAAAMLSQPFYPLTFLASIHPGPYTYNLMILARLFALGFGCALFVRLFAGFPASLVAGICGMFSGYFVVYYDIAHISVEIMLPWLLLAVELVIRRPAPRQVALLAMVWLIDILGGMPESTSLAGTVVLAYAAFRIYLDRTDHRSMKRTISILGGLGIGTIASGIILAPFLELMRNDFDLHQEANVGALVGLAYDPLWAPWLLTELSPLANGPPWNGVVSGFSGHSGFRGAPGVIAVLLAAVALVTAVIRFRARQVGDRVGLFLVLAACFVEGKRFGLPFAQWVGTLPLLSLVNFPKYGEAVVGVCVACAAGFGVDAIVRRRVPRGAVLAVSIALLATITVLYESFPLSSTTVHQEYVYLSIGFAVVLTIVTSAVAWNICGADRPKLALLFPCIALIEGAFAYLVPMFYIVNEPPAMARNPYAGAPFVSFLEKETAKDQDRVVATGGLLFPDWPSAFGLADPRNLNAIYPARYLRFVDAFLKTQPVTFDDWFDRFTGTRGIDFSSSRAQRWMQLSSVKYIVSPTMLMPPPDPHSFLSDLWRQVGPTIPVQYGPAVRPTVATIQKITQSVLFEHPPYDRVLYRTKIPKADPWLQSDLALDPSVWTGCGGPVTFRLDVLDSAGRNIGALERTIDPKHITAQRRWNHVAIDLRREAGSRATLRFATSVPASGNTCAAWAEWGDPRWGPTAGMEPRKSLSDPAMQQVFNSDVRVFRYSEALPRLRLLHRVIHVPGGEAALRALTTPSTDVRSTAIVEGPSPSVYGDGREDVIAVHQDTPNRMALEVNVGGDAVLVQNDTWYPGWKAFVDGSEAPLLRVNYLFRGLAIPAGHHNVVIAYDSPVVAVGIVMTLAGLGTIVFLLVAPALRSSSHRTEYKSER